MKIRNHLTILSPLCLLQALLSETSIDDSHWPPELILLREKFTAKSQLEIAQLQIKHKDEVRAFITSNIHALL